MLRFDGVEVDGLDEAIFASVRRRVSLLRLKRGTGIQPARWQYLLRRLPVELRTSLEPFGYYDPQIRLEPARDDQAVSLGLHVEVGKPTRVRQHRVRVQGPAQKDAAIAARIKAFAPRPGEVLRHAVYEESKRELRRALHDLGYFDAEEVEAKVEVTRALAAADIDLHIRSGPRYRFGTVQWHGSPFRADLLPPLVPFDADDRYRLDRILSLQKRLVDLDYFSRVSVQPRDPEAAETGGDDPAIGIDVELEPAKRHVYRTGASYGTDTGFAVKLGYDRRWLNAAGHKFSSDLLLGENRSAAKLAYRIPAFERYRGWWSATVSAREEPFADLRSDVLEVAVQREANWRGNQLTAGLHLHRERFDGQGDTLIFPQLTISRTVANDPLYPTRGFSWTLMTRGSASALGADVEFAQWQADAALIRGISDVDRILLRGTAGSIETPSGSIERIPPSFRFYAGGDRSVRGYGYQELGPRFEGDIRTGAERLLVGSVEWEHMFTPTWGGALFVDAGNAFGSTFDPAVGVGLGVRWRSPVGPVRVDLARGLDDPERSFRLHLQLGPQL